MARHKFPPEFCDYYVIDFLSSKMEKLFSPRAKANWCFLGREGEGRGGESDEFRLSSPWRIWVKNLTAAERHHWFKKKVDLSYSLMLCRKGDLVYSKRFGCWICQFNSSVHNTTLTYYLSASCLTVLTVSFTGNILKYTISCCCGWCCCLWLNTNNSLATKYGELCPSLTHPMRG